MKCSLFQAAVVSILLYGCTTWTLTKRLEKKLDGNYTKMQWAILNKSWRQHPTRHQLYGHLLPITKTIQVRRTRHAGHCWRSRDELISDILLWTPTYGRAKAGRPAKRNIQHLCENTGCGPKDLPEAMNDWEKWRERVRDIRACGTTWWWWWYIYIYMRVVQKVLNLTQHESKKLNCFSTFSICTAEIKLFFIIISLDIYALGPTMLNFFDQRRRWYHDYPKVSPRHIWSHYRFKFGLISLFNGISTFVGYLMPKPFS